MTYKETALLFVSIAATCTTQAQDDSDTRSKYGIFVTTCTFDMDDENFCSDKKMQKFAEVMETRAPNFNQDKLIYIYKSDNSVVRGHDHSYRMVLMDSKTKRVYPFYYAFHEAAEPVNSKGDFSEYQFSLDSNRFCFKGNVEAYRNAYDFDPEFYPEGFCFTYDLDTTNSDTISYYEVWNQEW